MQNPKSSALRCREGLDRQPHYPFTTAMKPTHLAVLLLVALALLALPITVHAAPAAPGPFSFHQPDGREITLRLRGDEWFHWYETLDGRPVTLDAASGYWVYR